MRKLKLLLSLFLIILTLACCSKDDNESTSNSINLELLKGQWRFTKDVQNDNNGNSIDEYIIDCSKEEIIEFTDTDYILSTDDDCDGNTDSQDTYSYFIGNAEGNHNVILVDGESEGAITTLNDTTLIFIFIDSIDGDGNYV